MTLDLFLVRCIFFGKFFGPFLFILRRVVSPTYAYGYGQGWQGLNKYVEAQNIHLVALTVEPIENN